MFSLLLSLFLAGLVTILLPCILPLIPIILGVSIADRHPLRPLATVGGMVVSFVAFTFVLQVLLSQFVELADFVQRGTYDVLVLFGLGFLFHARIPKSIGAVLASLFFIEKGWTAVVVAAVLNMLAMELGGRVAARIQQFGSNVQGSARVRLGSHQLLSAFVIGLTLGLVWVPCAGPALGFALALVRDKPGLTALLALTAYGIGAGLPLLAIGYGGQHAVKSVHQLNRYSELIKRIAGVILILTALSLRFNIFQNIQTSAGYGALGSKIENILFPNPLVRPNPNSNPSQLPILGKAPSSFINLGPWHNSSPLDLSDLRGKVILVDFWTYSCINCIRTLPYIQGYWERFSPSGKFVLIGVHTPEFTFEKSEKNVAMAIKEHGLTYPIAQDNDFGTWNAFENHYWPAKYLIDANGNIRYVHFGEGNYEETARAIESLLEEMGASLVVRQAHHDTARDDTAQDVTSSSVEKPITRETYLHSRSWDSFGNSHGAPNDRVLHYQIPASLQLHHFYLGGTWQLVDDERQVLQSSSGAIAIRATAGEVNLVLGLEEGAAPITADVTIDGKKGRSFTIDRHDLYNVFKGAYGEHDVVLTLHGKGVEAFAFTFGS